MAEIGERELKAQIKTEKFSNAYFIYGEESYLKNYYVERLKNKIVNPAFEDFNLHIYEGKDTSIDDILSSADMLPMMSEYNLLIVSDYPFDKNQSDIAKIKEYIKDIPPTSILVFVFDSIEVDVKRNSKWKSLCTAFAKAGSCVNLQRRTQSDLIKLINSGAKKRGAQISNENAIYLINTVGTDMITVLNELEKLSMYVNGGEITRSVIDEVAVKCLQARVYDLTKAMIKGDASAAYGVLESLLAQKTEPVVIMSVLGGCYIDMYRVKCAQTASAGASDVAKYYNYRGREFALNNALRDSRQLSIKQLSNAVLQIAQADNKLKSTSVDSRIVLEETIIKLLLICKEGC